VNRRIALSKLPVDSGRYARSRLLFGELTFSGDIGDSAHEQGDVPALFVVDC